MMQTVRDSRMSPIDARVGRTADMVWGQIEPV